MNETMKKHAFPLGNRAFRPSAGISAFLLASVVGVNAWAIDNGIPSDYAFFCSEFPKCGNKHRESWEAGEDIAKVITDFPTMTEAEE